MKLTKEKTVGEIVDHNFRNARILKGFGLNYCWDGDKRLGEACSEKGIDVTEVLSELRLMEGIDGTEYGKSNKWELDDIIDYIINHHHQYVKDSIPKIKRNLQVVVEEYGIRYPLLNEINRLFVKLSSDLQLHMVREEKIVFPFIRKISESRRNNMMLMARLASPFDSVKVAIEAMQREHINVLGLMNEIKTLCSNYSVPEDACETYKAAYERLKEFKKDLCTHLHMEDNVLFPKAILLEKELKKLKRTRLSTLEGVLEG